MLQKILGSHHEVHTQAEPWVLLHPLQALSEGQLQASYNHRLSVRGTRAFVESLPGGEDYYRETLGGAYRKLYEAILKAEGKRHFLDKTPRYYLIARELPRYFPMSRVICLLRNPLAVFNSIIETWAKDRLYTLSRYRQDLLEAPGILAELIRNPHDNFIFIRYEDMVTDPETHTRVLCEKLGLSYEASMVNYRRGPVFALGDPRGVDRYDRPQAGLKDAWEVALADPQRWRLQKEYLERLDAGTLQTLGYDREALAAVIARHTPTEEALRGTVGLDVLLNDQRDALLAVHRLQRELQAMERIVKRREGEIRRLSDEFALPSYRLARMLLAPSHLLRGFRRGKEKREKPFDERQ